MEKKQHTYDFCAISLKADVAQRFRGYSKTVAKTHSESLGAMMDFFEYHHISPKDPINGSLAALEGRIKKRVNSAIAIIRDIEKSQTLPTMALLQSLFEQQGVGEEVPWDYGDFSFDGKVKEEELLVDGEQQTTVPKIRYERLQEQMEALKIDFSNLLDQVRVVRPPLGKEYLKLDMDKQEIERYKRNLKNL
jgi:hypothetical protein